MISIRAATSADFPTLARIFLEARIKAFHWCDASTFHLSDFYTQTEGEVIHVATQASDMPVGFSSVWTPESFVHHLFVDPDYQNHGVGTLLLNSLRAWLPLPYRLKCLVDNAPARAFYLHKGWKDISVGRDSLGSYALMEFNNPEQPSKDNPHFANDRSSSNAANL